jgi:cytochrome b561
MQLRNSAERFGLVAQSIHWLTVLLVVLAWVLGQVGESLGSRAAEQSALFVHMSAGLAVIVLLALRLAWRTIDAPPAPVPSKLGWVVEKSATLTHIALYLLLIAVPVAGIVLQFARGRGIPLFGLGEIASPWAADRAFSRSVKEVHEVLANALIVVALLHAAAALIHHWVLRDRTLVRMLPHAGR